MTPNSPFHRTVLATVLAVLAAATIVLHPAAFAPDAGTVVAEKVVNAALRP